MIFSLSLFIIYDGRPEVLAHFIFACLLLAFYERSKVIIFYLRMKLLAFSGQLSAISCQLSAISFGSQPHCKLIAEP